MIRFLLFPKIMYILSEEETCIFYCFNAIAYHYFLRHNPFFKSLQKNKISHFSIRKMAY